MFYHDKTKEIAQENKDFRRVLHTGKKSQLVIMSIPTGGEIGEETHDHVEQTLYILSGKGKAVLNNEERTIQAGDFIVVEPGTKHNFFCTGEESMQIITVYAPPNHIDGRVHKTKADADADEEDEEFGHGAH